MITIAERLPEVYELAVRVPPTVQADSAPAVVWPPACTAVDSGGAAVLMRCEGGLEGQTLALAYPGFNPSLASFIRFELLDGSSHAAMLPPTTLQWLVPTAASKGQVAWDYLLLGIEHIIGGLDHLLFVLGLLVIARTPRRILLAVTGFTLAHSITLSLASLGLVRIPIVPVEATIALSILFLAQEISRERHEGLVWRYPLLVAFGFGLLHGLGFASALGEIGLAQNEVLVSLLFFNLGVETGQVLFIGAVLTLVLILQRLLPGAPRAAGGVSALGRSGELAASYLIGVPSAFWLIERVGQFVL